MFLNSKVVATSLSGLRSRPKVRQSYLGDFVPGPERVTHLQRDLWPPGAFLPSPHAGCVTACEGHPPSRRPQHLLSALLATPARSTLLLFLQAARIPRLP